MAEHGPPLLTTAPLGTTLTGTTPLFSTNNTAIMAITIKTIATQRPVNFKHVLRINKTKNINKKDVNNNL